MTVGATLVALAIVAWSAIAWFTGSQTATHDTNLAAMQIDFPAAGANHRIGTASADLVPGDWIQRTVQLDITANTNGDTMDDILLTTSGSGNPTFVTDADDGLQIWIQKCDQAWTEDDNDPYDYSCGALGGADDVLGAAATGTDFVGNNRSIGSGLDLSDGAHNYLMVQITFPATADDTMQGQSSTLSLQFIGQQRAGEGR
jgi:spore coat-associated protein N